jgi:hemerythrin-like domain-containing protein
MSTSPIPGFSSPGASTEAPLEMLAACHGRVEKQCDTLQRLMAWLPEHGCDEQARQAATAILRYFDTAAKDHHADEEQDLFPALLEAMAGSDAVCIRELTVQLIAEHRRLELLWATLRQSLLTVAAGTLEGSDLPGMEAFLQGYQAHLQKENDHLLPMATRLLSDEQLTRMGIAMRQRRGIVWQG